MEQQTKIEGKCVFCFFLLPSVGRIVNGKYNNDNINDNNKKKRPFLCVLDTVFLDKSSSSPLLSSKGTEEEKWKSYSTNKNCPMYNNGLDFTSKSVAVVIATYSGKASSNNTTGIYEIGATTHVTAEQYGREAARINAASAGGCFSDKDVNG
eukprot:15364760-Ditylum_brightwellii.AAC.1